MEPPLDIEAPRGPPPYTQVFVAYASVLVKIQLIYISGLFNAFARLVYIPHVIIPSDVRHPMDPSQVYDSREIRVREMSCLFNTKALTRKSCGVKQYPEDSGLPHAHYGYSYRLARQDADIASIGYHVTVFSYEPTHSRENGKQYRGTNLPVSSLMQPHIDVMNIIAALSEAALADFVRWLYQRSMRGTAYEPSKAGSHEPSTSSHRAGGKEAQGSSETGSFSRRVRPPWGDAKRDNSGDGRSEGEDGASAGPPAQGSRNESKKLACPFYKRRPGSFPGCSHVGYSDFTRLKA